MLLWSDVGLRRTCAYYRTSARAMCVRKCVRKGFVNCACVVGACGPIFDLRRAIALFLVDRGADKYVNRIPYWGARYMYRYIVYLFTDYIFVCPTINQDQKYRYILCLFTVTYSSASLSTKIKKKIKQFWLHFEWSKMSPTKSFESCFLNSNKRNQNWVT